MIVTQFRDAQWMQELDGIYYQSGSSSIKRKSHSEENHYCITI